MWSWKYVNIGMCITETIYKLCEYVVKQAYPENALVFVI